MKGTDTKRPDHDVEIISLLEEDYTSHSSFHSQSSPPGNFADVSGVSPTVGEIPESEHASEDKQNLRTSPSKKVINESIERLKKNTMNKKRFI